MMNEEKLKKRLLIKRLKSRYFANYNFDKIYVDTKFNKTNKTKKRCITLYMNEHKISAKFIFKGRWDWIRTFSNTYLMKHGIDKNVCDILKNEKICEFISQTIITISNEIESAFAFLTIAKFYKPYNLPYDVSKIIAHHILF
jgi:hypothetical protein